jgi:Carboxypeptidase regulatory-like domain/Polysaccharide lyase family 4, domain II
MDRATIGRPRVSDRSSLWRIGRAGRPVCVGVLITFVALSLLRADDRKAGAKSTDPKPAAAPPADAKTFELRIVDPDDKPVPDARVTLNMSPRPNDVKLRAGKLVNKSRNSLVLQSGADGRVAIERPARLEYLNYQIRKPGYGYHWNWINLRNKKAEADLGPQTAKLQRAWTIGGIFVDSDGKPVPNVRVILQLQMNAGQFITSDRIYSNSKGIWKFESVPESMSEVTAQINEPKFVPENPTLSRAEFRVEPGREPSALITLETGLTVTGTVTDDGGKPIAKALVRTTINNDTRSAFTDKKGLYGLEGCAPGNSRIVASAKGRAPDLQDVAIGPGLGPVDFRLKPGNTIRVRVLDEKGKPVPKATVYFQRWRGRFGYFEFDQAPRQADDDGVWEWKEAPAEEVLANIGRPGGITITNRPLSPRKEEYVFRIPSALVIKGKVVDAETKQPIKNFQVESGYLWMGQQVQWDQRNKKPSTGSTYEIRKTDNQGDSFVRVEADGYMSAVSREIKCEEANVTIDFELPKGKTVAATVLSPDGTPAARAKVALPGPGEQLIIFRGDLQEPGDIGGNGNLGGIIVGLVRQFRQGRQAGPGLVAVHETDKDGKFRAEAKNPNCWIVVTHATGYAELIGMPSSNPRVIKLKPWARVEGTYQIARQPASNEPISVNKNQYFFQNSPFISVQSMQTTDRHGRFVVDRVVPGQQRISGSRTNRLDDAETTSSMAIIANCPAGKTTHVDLGMGGRPVIGQLRKPADAKPDLQLSSTQIWVSQEGGQMWGGGGGGDESQVQFNATTDRDGNFSIEDVPPGSYVLSAWLMGQQGPQLQIQQHRFTVTTVNAKLSQRPVDLGVLTLSLPNERRAVKAAVRKR